MMSEPLACLAEVFSELNTPSSSMQGHNTDVIQLCDRLSPKKKKKKKEDGGCKYGRDFFPMFPSVDELGNSAVLLLHVTCDYLEALEGHLGNIFLRLVPGTGTRHGYTFYSKKTHQMDQTIH